MKRSAIIQAMHEGIRAAAETYAEWSGGRRLHDDGIENLLTVRVAETIWKARTDAKARHRLRLETKFSEIRDLSGRKNSRGRPSTALDALVKRGSKRVDISIWNSAGKPVGVVEMKRTANARSAKADGERIARFCEYCGKSYSGSIQYGFFGVFIEQDMSRRSNPLSRSVEQIEKELAKLASKQVSITFHKSGEYSIEHLENGANYKVMSLVVEIASRYGSRATAEDAIDSAQDVD